MFDGSLPENMKQGFLMLWLWFEKIRVHHVGHKNPGVTERVTTCNDGPTGSRSSVPQATKMSCQVLHLFISWVLHFFVYLKRLFKSFAAIAEVIWSCTALYYYKIVPVSCCQTIKNIIRFKLEKTPKKNPATSPSILDMKRPSFAAKHNLHDKRQPCFQPLANHMLSAVHVLKKTDKQLGHRLFVINAIHCHANAAPWVTSH